MLVGRQNSEQGKNLSKSCFIWGWRRKKFPNLNPVSNSAPKPLNSHNFPPAVFSFQSHLSNIAESYAGRDWRRFFPRFLPRRNENAFVFEDGFRVGGRRPGRAVRVGAGLKGGGRLPPFTKGEGIRESGNRFPMLSAPFGNLGAVGFQMFAEGARFVEKCGCIGVIWPHTGGIFISLGMRPPARSKVPGGVQMSGAGILKARASIERPASKCKIRAAAVLIPLPRLAEIRGRSRKILSRTRKNRIAPDNYRDRRRHRRGPAYAGLRKPGRSGGDPRVEPAAAFAKCLPMPAAVCPGRLGRRAPLRPAQAGVFKSLLSCGYGRKTGGRPFRPR